ncbi:MAG: amidohydrolase family protein [Ectothiorhodospiraceae bacterium]|nr:amidohydrolase family protein [Ectothiorhodospiraceae bacterium]
MSSTLFRNGRLYVGGSDALLDGHEVLVENGRIAAVSDRPITAAATRTVDLGGRTLMPGLIDAHYHAIAAHPNFALVDAMPQSLVAQHSRSLLEASLQRGFTTIRDAGGADYGLARAIEQGLIRGPRLFYSGAALSQTGGHGDFRPYEQPVMCSCGMGARSLARIVDGVPEVRRAARDELRKGATQIKIMASGGVASPSDPVWNLQFSEEEIRAAVWEARSWRTYVMAHAYTPEAIARCIQYGVRSIEHGNLIDAAAASVVAEHDAFVVPTLATYESLAARGGELGMPQSSLDKLSDVRDAGLRSLEILTKAGAKIGFGTDLLGAMHADQLTEFEIRARVLPVATVLRQATTINAELLQREGELGTVSAGALADLIVVDGDPLADLSVLGGNGERVVMVMKGGEVFKDTL